MAIPFKSGVAYYVGNQAVCCIFPIHLFALCLLLRVCLRPGLCAARPGVLAAWQPEKQSSMQASMAKALPNRMLFHQPFLLPPL